ncbi:uncharacterized protein LOC131396698 isoform X5 [Diceros bicornis minor]|uniref:uncharacterized protein LOC131396698 isoform X5 n=1 Tax=Diceros bicornis minor TaxID=77932 RepID=UPI0026EDB037|nr:uncharacterized protein LOC131396698 isoform X5 [Diceros bicornis minor]
MPLEEHMGEVSWESSEKFKESYSQDVSLNRELMTKEGPSTFAPRRATPRECRRSSSSSRSNTKGRGLQEIKSNLPTGVAGLPMDVQARHCQKNYISSPIARTVGKSPEEQ